MPKAGGTSFKSYLKNTFSEKLYLDYTDFPDHLTDLEIIKLIEKYSSFYYPFKKTYFDWKGKKIFHGHFLAKKYECYLENKNTVFMTWLRDPLERLASQYYYWKRTYNNRSLPFHREVIENNWSFEKFCFSEQMRNLYSKFLVNFPIQNFDFIGIVEYIEEDFKFLSENILEQPNSRLENLNSNPEISKSYFENCDYYEELKKHHSKD